MLAIHESLSGLTGMSWMFECHTSSFGRIGQLGASGIADAAAGCPGKRSAVTTTTQASTRPTQQ